MWCEIGVVHPWHLLIQVLVGAEETVPTSRHGDANAPLSLSDDDESVTAATPRDRDAVDLRAEVDMDNDSGWDTDLEEEGARACVCVFLCVCVCVCFCVCALVCVNMHSNKPRVCSSVLRCAYTCVRALVVVALVFVLCGSISACISSA